MLSLIRHVFLLVKSEVILEEKKWCSMCAHAFLHVWIHPAAYVSAIRILVQGKTVVAVDIHTESLVWIMDESVRNIS